MRTFIALLFIVAAGCGASVSPYARASAGHIGCPAEAIELTQIERGGGAPQSWVATCGHAAYACSSNADPASREARIVCSELGRPRRAAYWHSRMQ
jgi:hypothetical protein